MKHGQVRRRAGMAWAVILMASSLETARAAPSCSPEQAKEIRIGVQRWHVQVARTPGERERGLSGRRALPVGAGMWFVLPSPGFHGFWMKDMAFPIDLVWVTPGAQAIAVETLLPCGAGPCPIRFPPQPVGFVLETAAGTVKLPKALPVRWQCVGG